MDNRLILTILLLLVLSGSFVGAATFDFVSPSDGETLSVDSVTVKVNLLDVSNLNNSSIPLQQACY